MPVTSGASVGIVEHGQPAVVKFQLTSAASGWPALERTPVVSRAV